VTRGNPTNITARVQTEIPVKLPGGGVRQTWLETAFLPCRKVDETGMEAFYLQGRDAKVISKFYFQTNPHMGPKSRILWLDPTLNTVPGQAPTWRVFNFKGQYRPGGEAGRMWIVRAEESGRVEESTAPAG
jgi:hypothetical protein